jgi:hypothetical protein
MVLRMRVGGVAIYQDIEQGVTKVSTSNIKTPDERHPVDF